MLIGLLVGYGDTEAAPLEPAEPSQNTEENTQTDILDAAFDVEDVKEYPIEYTDVPKTVEVLTHELSELTGLDFFITASNTDDGRIVD